MDVLNVICLKLARALRFQANLTICFWGDCVLVAAHIINRLFVPILNHQTPFEILYQTSPSYSHLRVFECLAFTSNPFCHHDKFLQRGVPCVFIGFPSNQNGYRLYNLLTHQCFVSRDVRFSEHILPYKLFSHTPPAEVIIPSSTELSPLTNPVDSLPPAGSPFPCVPHDPPLRKSTRPTTKPTWHDDYVMITHLSHLPPTKL